MRWPSCWRYRPSMQGGLLGCPTACATPPLPGLSRPSPISSSLPSPTSSRPAVTVVTDRLGKLITTRLTYASSCEDCSGKAAAQVSQWPITAFPIEHGVYGFERPGLIEDDPVVEQPWPIEHDPSVVQVGQQMLGRADPTGLIAQLAKMRLGESAVLPLPRWHRSVGVAQLLEPLLHLEPSSADSGFAF